MDSPELEYVGFWLRFWAFVIDSTLVMVILVPIADAVFSGEVSDWSAISTAALSSQKMTDLLLSSMSERTTWTPLLIEFALAAVTVLVFWMARQTTPGKMAIGASIVDAASGKRPTAAQFVGRYFAYYVSLIPFGLGFVWVGIDARKQAWHDKLAGTVVVRPRHNAATVQFKAP